MLVMPLSGFGAEVSCLHPLLQAEKELGIQLSWPTVELAQGPMELK